MFEMKNLLIPQSRRVDAPGGAEEESETTGVARLEGCASAIKPKTGVENIA